MQLRVAACQILTYPDVKQSAEKIAEWIRKASDQNVDVVAFPEASLCGYPCTAEYWKKATPGQRQLHHPAGDNYTSPV